MRTCTRRLEFDAAHRVTRHESKCRNLHGHRYVVDVTCEAEDLDSVDRVVDFSVIKARIGGWIDERLDHGTIANEADRDLIALCDRSGWKVQVVKGEPTAENLAEEIAKKGQELLEGTGVRVRSVRVYETPNCWADYP